MTIQAGHVRLSATVLLLNLDLGSRRFELLLGRGGLFLAHVFLDGLGRALDQVLGLLQAQRGQLADGLDDVDLVGADLLEDDGELRLLFRRRGRRAPGPPPLPPRAPPR